MKNEEFLTNKLNRQYFILTDRFIMAGNTVRVGDGFQCKSVPETGLI